MNDPSDGIAYVVVFPIWGLFHPGPGDMGLALRLPNGQTAAVFFTEELFAERFRDSIPAIKNNVIKKIGDASFFSAVIANCKKYGINYVAFDPTDEASARARAFPFDAMRPWTISD
jgi:hypothetical protein